MDVQEVFGYAVAVARTENKWTVITLDDEALKSISVAEQQVRQIRSEGAVFGVLNVDDEFFIILRPGPARTRIFVSDATAAIDYGIAAEALGRINVEVPDLDDDEFEETEPWAEGDFSILFDLGLPDDVLSVIVDDYELFADEQVSLIAKHLGFLDELEESIESYG